MLFVGFYCMYHNSKISEYLGNNWYDLISFRHLTKCSCSKYGNQWDAMRPGGTNNQGHHQGSLEGLLSGKGLVRWLEVLKIQLGPRSILLEGSMNLQILGILSWIVVSLDLKNWLGILQNVKLRAHGQKCPPVPCIICQEIQFNLNSV